MRIVELVEIRSQERVFFGLRDSDVNTAQEIMIKVDVDSRARSDGLVFRIPRKNLDEELLSDAKLDILAYVPPVLAQIKEYIRARLSDIAVVTVEAARIPYPALETIFPAREERFK